MLKPIPGWPLYYASDDGEIWSRQPKCLFGRRVEMPSEPHKLKAVVKRKGYRAVSLVKDGYKRQCWIGILVLEAFAGPRPERMQVCHGPNGSGDDSLANLCWGTLRKNYYDDKLRDGTLMRGREQWQAKLNEKTVMEIYNLRGSLSQKRIAVRYGIDQTTVSNVQTGKTWYWLTGADHKIIRRKA